MGNFSKPIESSLFHLENLQAFELLSRQVRRLNQRPTKDEWIRLYGLYKQITAGDAPGRSAAGASKYEQDKWNSWSNCSGIDRIRLLEKYNDLAEELIAKYTVADLGKSNPKIRGKEVKWSKEPKFD